MNRRAALAAGLVLLVLTASGGSAPKQEFMDASPSVPSPAASSPDPSAAAPGPTPTPAATPRTRPTATRRPVARRPVGPLGTTRMTGVKAVALTFDDGPHPDWTPKVLDRLRAAKVKATFCLIGVKVHRYPALVARIVREGHSLCNHSWQHDLKLGSKTPAEIRADLQRTNKEIRRAVPGARIPYYRQPGGKWTPAVVKIAKELGMTSLHWDVDPADWEKPGAPVISERIAQQARPGSIVLLHDGGGDRSDTLGACPLVLSSLKQKYGIVRLR